MLQYASESVLTVTMNGSLEEKHFKSKVSGRQSFIILDKQRGGNSISLYAVELLGKVAYCPQTFQVI